MMIIHLSCFLLFHLCLCELYREKEESFELLEEKTGQDFEVECASIDVCLPVVSSLSTHLHL